MSNINPDIMTININILRHIDKRIFYNIKEQPYVFLIIQKENSSVDADVLFKWISKNIKTNWTYDDSNPELIVVSMADKDEAVLFKLQWGHSAITHYEYIDILNRRYTKLLEMNKNG